MGRKKANTESLEIYDTTIINRSMTEEEESLLIEDRLQESADSPVFLEHDDRAFVLRKFQELIQWWREKYDALLGADRWSPKDSFLNVRWLEEFDQSRIQQYQDNERRYLDIYNDLNGLNEVNMRLFPVLEKFIFVNNVRRNQDIYELTDLPRTPEGVHQLISDLVNGEIEFRINLAIVLHLVEKYIIALIYTSFINRNDEADSAIQPLLKQQLKLVAGWMSAIKTVIEFYYTTCAENAAFIERCRIEELGKRNVPQFTVDSGDDDDVDLEVSSSSNNSAVILERVSSNISKPVPSDPIPPHVSGLSKRSLHDPELTKQFILELYPESDASHAPQLAETKPENTPSPIDWSKFKSSRKAYEREFLAGNLGNEPIGEMGVLAGAKGVLLDYVNGTLGMSRFFHPKRHHGVEVRKILAIKTLPELIDALKAVDKKAEGSLARRIAFIEEKIRTYVPAFTSVEASKPFDFNGVCVPWNSSIPVKTNYY